MLLTIRHFNILIMSLVALVLSTTWEFTAFVNKQWLVLLIFSAVSKFMTFAKKQKTAFGIYLARDHVKELNINVLYWKDKAEDLASYNNELHCSVMKQNEFTAQLYIACSRKSSESKAHKRTQVQLSQLSALYTKLQAENEAQQTQIKRLQKELDRVKFEALLAKFQREAPSETEILLNKALATSGDVVQEFNSEVEESAVESDHAQSDSGIEDDISEKEEEYEEAFEDLFQEVIHDEPSTAEVLVDKALGNAKEIKCEIAACLQTMSKLKSRHDDTRDDYYTLAFDCDYDYEEEYSQLEEPLLWKMKRSCRLQPTSRYVE